MATRYQHILETSGGVSGRAPARATLCMGWNLSPIHPCPLRRSCPPTRVCSTMLRRPRPHTQPAFRQRQSLPSVDRSSHPEALCPRLRRRRACKGIKVANAPGDVRAPFALLLTDVTTTLPPRRFWSLGRMAPSACQRALEEMLDTHKHTCGARARSCAWHKPERLARPC